MVNVVGCDTLTVASSSGECVFLCCSNCFGDCNNEFISNPNADYFETILNYFQCLLLKVIQDLEVKF